VVTTVETDPCQAAIDVLAGQVKPATSHDPCDCDGHR